MATIAIHPLDLVLIIGFIIAALAVIPLDRALERRRARNRWRMARRKNVVRRAAARWTRA